MDVVLFLAVGLVASVATARMLPWRQADSRRLLRALSIMGAFTGGFIGHLLGYRGTEPPVFVTSALGALAMGVLYEVAVAARTAK